MMLHTAAHALAYRIARRAIRPKAPLLVSEWADANRVLSEEGSAEPGRWRTSRNPPQREILDALSEDAPGEKVVLMKPSQWGGTEIGSNFVGYCIDHVKGPGAVVMPTEASLQDWTSQKFDPMVKDTPVVNESMALRSNRSGDNAAKRKRFKGGLIYFKTSGSTAELKASSLKWGMADEVDEWDWTTPQGDPLGLFEIRFAAFHNSKLFIVSSPTVKDASKIEEQFEAGDQRRYHVPCPHCGERQVLKWNNLKWKSEYTSYLLREREILENSLSVRWDREDSGIKSTDVDSTNVVRKGFDAFAPLPTVKYSVDTSRVTRAWYVCEHCGCEIDEHQKPGMLAAGRWIAENPGALYRSYHINGIYTPIGIGRSWVQLAQEWIEAQGDAKKLVIFINTRLAESWADRSHDLKPNALIARAEPYALRTIPQGVLVLTAGVDTQDDRLEVRVIGWGADKKEWTIDYHIIPGKPSGDEVWAALDDYLTAEFTNSYGKTLRIEATAIDTGGHFTHDVYAYVRRAKARRVIACKGASTTGRVILGKPSHQDVNWRGQTVKKGVALYIVGTDTAKHHIYGRLNDDTDKDPGERKVHFSTELEHAFFDQQVSEVFNPRKNRWEIKKGKRNEVLDTHVYATAASHHPELYLHKWKAADWKRRAAMIEPEQTAEPAETSAEQKPIEAPKKPPVKTRMPGRNHGIPNLGW